MEVLEATGCSITPEQLTKSRQFNIVDYGAGESVSPVENTAAINAAIAAANEAGGGTVIVPTGTFLVYTVRLKSNVNIYLSHGAVLAAAKTELHMHYMGQTIDQAGEGGNYDEPEVNPNIGVQDHGHTYFANSLIYGADLENIMIYGSGLITGGRYNQETGVYEYVLQGDDPQVPKNVNGPGHNGTWFGNKGIALVRCKNIVLMDFSITIGGHFAIICSGCENIYADWLLIDTNRDAFDIDSCKDVTVRHTTANSLTDDGLCIKASYGAGVFMPAENILIEDCTVCGYDAGSVYAKAYTRSKAVADDRCGPTGRVKLGTESTCGYKQVTVRRVKFDRCRGIAMEAVDGSPMEDIVFEDCEMNDISNSPLFIRVGDRGRWPVLDGEKRYRPVYDRTREVTVDGLHKIAIINDKNKICLEGRPTSATNLASAARIRIKNIKVKNADPRYPMLVMGMTDSPIRDVEIANIEVEYRGGLTMKDAVEQRQIDTPIRFSQFHATEIEQLVPWMVNTFFVKNEGLLPRVDWDGRDSGWVDDPYNVPELPEVYPEPSNWGILPAWGLYVRHCENINVQDAHFTTIEPDGRHIIVLDDVNGACLNQISAKSEQNTHCIATVTNNYRRHTNRELVADEPYFTTKVQGLKMTDCFAGYDNQLLEVVVDAPAPGTPEDSLYNMPTVACQITGYNLDVARPLPKTVFPLLEKEISKC